MTTTADRLKALDHLAEQTIRACEEERKKIIRSGAVTLGILVLVLVGALIKSDSSWTAMAFIILGAQYFIVRHSYKACSKRLRRWQKLHQTGAGNG